MSDQPKKRPMIYRESKRRSRALLAAAIEHMKANGPATIAELMEATGSGHSVWSVIEKEVER